MIDFTVGESVLDIDYWTERDSDVYEAMGETFTQSGTIIHLLGVYYNKRKVSLNKFWKNELDEFLEGEV